MTWVGIDRTPGGWVVATLEVGRVELAVTESLAPVDAEVVAIDIPLSLPETVIGRACETEARRMLGGRASTVFSSLPRWCYEAPYTSATLDKARARLGSAFSKQAWSLGPAILEAMAVSGGHWFETHPELAFRVRAGGPVAPKKTWNGVYGRLRVLADLGVSIGDGPDGVPPDDVIDAVVCAVVASDIAAGTAHSVPGEGPDRIWY
ncbi:MAG: DUF429 domain-containing protein [Acidimicrobiia bacterium]|nr:DUF429 domain-containing protein [Acidimicrobiia bacterium]MDH4306651.1 DUF429 domain-containing protein [Acidimicrobiia bacterium]